MLRLAAKEEHQLDQPPVLEGVAEPWAAVCRVMRLERHQLVEPHGRHPFGVPEKIVDDKNCRDHRGQP